MTKIKSAKIGLFGTLGAYPDSDHAVKAMANAEALVESDNKILGHYICMGKIDSALTERLNNLPAYHPHAMTPKRMARHINHDDFAMARDLYRTIMKDLDR